MAQDAQILFHQGLCAAPECRAPFWICRFCYRGQRYCGERCRIKTRRVQRREANRRHQQDPDGRLDHRDRQRAYRLRRIEARVTDQSSNASSASATIGRPISPPMTDGTLDRAEEGVDAKPSPALWARRSLRGSVCCNVCGRLGRFIDPFGRRR